MNEWTKLKQQCIKLSTLVNNKSIISISACKKSAQGDIWRHKINKYTANITTHDEIRKSVNGK